MTPAKIVSTIRKGSLRIDVRAYARGRFGFDYEPPGDVRRQVRLLSQDDAEDKARELLGAAHGGKVERLAIDEDEYAEFLRWRAERTKAAPTGTLATSFLKLKKARADSGEMTEKHYWELEGILSRFSAQFPGPIHALERAKVERWLNGLELSAKRWNHYRAAIVALVRFARADNLVGADSLPIERIPARSVKTTIETYTPEELEALLLAVGAHRKRQDKPEAWLPLVVLGAFAGLRPEEIAPMDPKKRGLHWENILWAKGKIDVPPEVSKTRRRRFVPLLPACAAWLEPWRKSKGPVAPALGRACDQTPAWTKASGVRWKYDALRHSYASYRLAVTHDMAALALEMGNSPSMIFLHYLDLKHEEDAERYFGIRPAAPANVLRIA